VELRAGERVARDGYDIAPYRTQHGPRSLGYALIEHERLGRFNPDLARQLGVPEGPLFGGCTAARTSRWRPHRSALRPGGAAAAGSTRRLHRRHAPVRETLDIARDADLLIHDATFAHDEAERARETNHATAREGRSRPGGRAHCASRSRTSRRATRRIRARSSVRRATCSLAPSSRTTGCHRDPVPRRGRDGRVSTVVRVPGDKSLTHRALILAALATGRSRIRGALVGADTESTAACLRALGCAVPLLTDELSVDGVGLRGLRAAVARWTAATAAPPRGCCWACSRAIRSPHDLTGDVSLQSRPMRRVTQPLAAMGARFEELGEADRLPLRVHGGTLHSLEYRSPHASAQVKSAVLLAGLVGGVDVAVSEPALSRDHTERMLLQLGVELTRSDKDGARVQLTAVDALQPLDFRVPGDFSSAAFVLARACLGAGEVVVNDVGVNPTRTGLLNVLRRMNASVGIVREGESCGEPIADLRAAPSALRAVHVTAAEVPALIDEVPVIAMLAARAEGVTVIEGAGELRVKESDRIAAIVDNLRAVGVQAEARGDDLVVEGTDRPLAGRVRALHDHRIAMAFGVLAAGEQGRIVIDDPGIVRVSFPGFWRVMLQAGSR
jgi:3-phosphoshikimate 1-carboxyvinyltransferase